MLKSKNIEVEWNPKNKKHYESKGYVFTKCKDKFSIKIEDLPPSSSKTVDVVCDRCGIIKQMRYVDYLKCHNNTGEDLCKKCNRSNSSETVFKHYGVYNPSQSKEIQTKKEETCLKHFGVKNPFQSEELKDIIRENQISAVRKKYGCDCVLQNKSIISKARETYYKNGSCPTSKPQIALYNLLNEIYGNCELNYPCNNCSLDCMIVIDGVSIDIEYDAPYWHQDEQKDRRRDEFIKSQGYKILRIQSKHKIPSKQQIKEAIDYLVKDGHSFMKIKLDI